MAIQKAYYVNFLYFGDGLSTSYSFDLESDPYYIAPQTINWFTEAKKLPNPIGVFSPSPSIYTLSLSGTTVTVTFATAPLAGQVGSFDAVLLFQ